MRDAILVALHREAKGSDGKRTRRLYVIADRLVEKAMDGDIQAIKEINDRVDGKATQPLTGDKDAPLALDFAGIKEALAQKLARLAGE